MLKLLRLVTKINGYFRAKSVVKLASLHVLAHCGAVFSLVNGYFMSRLAQILHPATPYWSGRLHRHSHTLPHPWRSWLLNSASLTARLTALRPGEFRVQPLAQYYGQATVTERTELGLSTAQPVWVREVQLLLADAPVVYARTAIPLTTLTGAERELQRLGNKSLGSYLFRHPQFKRGPLYASRCAPNDLGLDWTRRSIFYLGQKPVMVSEAFTSHLLDFLLS